MKTKYVSPEILAIKLEGADVITSSPIETPEIAFPKSNQLP